ncbi:Uracil-DNA glycosylase, family 4 [hydrothermal vent metagenome]|uniref:Type-4 uracil-DNA glycosylase n=1 Tax=hydrothermal vent metagenome TaxID=652676 RepID=A0A3B1AE09_9ZZZZ
MKSLNPTQRACIEAMGIDVWVPREKTEPLTETLAIEKASADITVTAPKLEGKSESADLQPATEIKTKEVAEIIPESTAPEIPTDWNGLRQVVSTCQKCALHATRTHAVFGSGNQNADWLIVGDIPSVSDDKLGDVFTDQSGELLTAMLKAISLTRHQVYIANTLKCITPNNREPEADESETCFQYLQQQIELIKPKLILVVGQSAAQRLLKTHSTMARLRQKVHTLEGINIPVVVTYHPAYLLNMPADKAKAWQDLLLAKKTISATAVL